MIRHKCDDNYCECSACPGRQEEKTMNEGPFLSKEIPLSVKNEDDAKKLLKGMTGEPALVIVPTLDGFEVHDKLGGPPMGKFADMGDAAYFAGAHKAIRILRRQLAKARKQALQREMWVGEGR